LWGDSSAKWAGKEVGGIRVKALSDIPENGLGLFVTISRGLRRKQTIDFLKILPTEDDLNWIKAIQAGQSKLDDISDKSRRNKIKSFLQQRSNKHV